MAFLPAERGRVLVHTLLLTGYIKSMSNPVTVDMLDVTCINDGSGADSKSRVFIPGRESSTTSFAGPLDVDTTTGGQWDVLTSWKGSTGLTVTYAPSGLTAGNECFLESVLIPTFGSTATPAGTTDWSVAGQTNGSADMGTILEPSTAVTVDGNGTARDSGIVGGTTNGGVAHIHVTAFSGLTSDVVTIEHSVDGSTSWTTLATFATVTGRTSERVAVAAGTTVRRYLRVVDDVTGTGSVTRSVAFARR